MTPCWASTYLCLSSSQFDRLKIKYEAEAAGFQEQLSGVWRGGAVHAATLWVGGAPPRAHALPACLPTAAAQPPWLHCLPATAEMKAQVSSSLNQFAAGDISAEQLIAFLGGMGVELRVRGWGGGGRLWLAGCCRCCL